MNSREKLQDIIDLMRTIDRERRDLDQLEYDFKTTPVFYIDPWTCEIKEDTVGGVEMLYDDKAGLTMYIIIAHGEMNKYSMGSYGTLWSFSKEDVEKYLDLWKNKK